mmetsp:Transcript_14443/g.41089  ORF Transcript_14443/g.41089 Transcript_14443/m.41089 type:complete len:288 (+) Transcript_14443:512-1375(+)
MPIATWLYKKLAFQHLEWMIMQRTKVGACIGFATRRTALLEPLGFPAVLLLLMLLLLLLALRWPRRLEDQEVPQTREGDPVTRLSPEELVLQVVLELGGRASVLVRPVPLVELTHHDLAKEADAAVRQVLPFAQAVDLRVHGVESLAHLGHVPGHTIHALPQGLHGLVALALLRVQGGHPLREEGPHLRHPVPEARHLGPDPADPLLEDVLGHEERVQQVREGPEAPELHGPGRPEGRQKKNCEPARSLGGPLPPRHHRLVHHPRKLLHLERELRDLDGGTICSWRH